MVDLDVMSLGEAGYVRGLGFLGEALVTRAHGAALSMARSGALSPAGVGRGADRQLRADVRSDLTGWIDPATGGPLGEVAARFEALRLVLNREAFLSLSGLELQLAWYPPGGTRYARHLDSFARGPARRVTAIVYLNPAWQPAHGGELRLHVAPAPVDVAPVADGWVVFLSDRVEHEVLPSFADRFAITAWYS